MIRRRRKAHKRARFSLDVFDNPFASKSRKGVRRIHRNDGRFAKAPWSKRKGVRLRKARSNPAAYANPFVTKVRGKKRVRRNDGQFAAGSWSKSRRVKAKRPHSIPWQKKLLAGRLAAATRANPFVTKVRGKKRVRRNDGQFAAGSWSKTKRVKARRPAPIPWEKKMLAARKRARHNPFLDGVGRVHRNDGRFAKSPYSTARPWMTTEHGRIPWLPGTRSNPTPGVSPSGWDYHDLDVVFSNPMTAKERKAILAALNRRQRSTGTRKMKHRLFRIGGHKVLVRGNPKKTRKTAKKSKTKSKAKKTKTKRTGTKALAQALGLHLKSNRLHELSEMHDTYEPTLPAYRREAPKRTGSGLYEFSRASRATDRATSNALARYQQDNGLALRHELPRYTSQFSRQNPRRKRRKSRR